METGLNSGRSLIDARGRSRKNECMPVTRGLRVNVFFDEDKNPDSPNLNKPKKTSKGMDPLPPFDGNSDIINITSGDLQAKLHRQRFICPGINRDCVEYDGRLVTPKTFYILADKGSLKDWKNAIRINGKKLRRYIDSGALDFYNHKELCTGRCKSRFGNKTSLLPMDHGIGLSSSPANLRLDTSVNADSGFNSSNESIVTDSFGEPRDVKPTAEQLSMMLQGTSDSLDSSSTLERAGIHPVKLHSHRDPESEEEEDEDQLFWRAIVQLGLIDEFFREIKSRLDILKVNMIKNFVNLPDAKKASVIVNELGMKAKLDMRLSAHKFEFDRQRDKLEREMEQLKKKVSEYEQKKEILRLKSDCYENLMAKKIKNEDHSTNSFTFETSSGTQMILRNEEQSDNESRSRSVSPVPPNPAEISLIQKQRKMLVSKKRKTESGGEIPTKFTIETPNGPTTVLLSQETEESSRPTSPCPTTSQDSSTTVSHSQDSSTEMSNESLSQESSIA